MRWLPALVLSVLVLSGCSAEPEADAQATTVSASQTAAPTASPPTVSAFAANVTGLDVAFAFAAAGNGTNASLAWSLAFGDGNHTNGTALPGAANHTYAAAGSYNATLVVRQAGASANRTIQVNVTGNATAPVVVLATFQFTGSLPFDGATVGSHTFAVPAGATQVTMAYTSDYVGLFTAVASATDPAGTERMYSLDACSVGFAPPSGTTTCAMATEGPVDAGDWLAEVSYQLGQASEDYTLDLVVYGVA